MWRGHKTNYVSAGCGQPVVLVHGFGASVGHYRKNIEVLAKHYKVYAVDLLGFGASDKAVVEYSMELWRDQVLDFMKEFVQTPAVVVGNSIGGLTTLMAAAEGPNSVKGVVLLNCAVGMNSKAAIDDWRIVVIYPLLFLIDLLLKSSLARWLFDKYRSKENIRNIVSKVYRNQEAVDDALVDLLYRPSCDPGAVDVFVSVLTGQPGPRPWEVAPRVSAPLLILWGDSDPFTPVDGPTGQFFQSLPKTRSETVFQLLEDVGHCPHDDRPDQVHKYLLPWLESVYSQDASKCQANA
ncbi:hypothetical protein CEUSTIGMA_g6557.t1 [Chlamydomonas eustigma]|uniref:AB hydrolase-1 domain-containing protein n=1 Tax=Chlamydomonas eustigma TaxID=1157962 RepID=A0A250X7S7_9CHLO|nr:hypothetical protein CEUSTIGMA_g6557.t1 [Chlamydomonas eustigma]|eukprot:GAX79117.1 hypothetical protein CEUSTIGMA_g6557.t1 [Chlamydomonas eustigma]